MLAYTLALAALAAVAQAQQGQQGSTVSSVSSDPLNGSTFVTPVYTPEVTYTPTATYASASGGNPTAVSGPGPTADPASYTFSYTIPTSTVPATADPALSSSLAADGEPTGADVKNLIPSPEHLQNVDAASRQAISAMAVFAAVGAGAVLTFLL